MANSTSVAERLEEFMLTLTPEAIALLVGAAEKSRLKSESDPVSEMILQAAVKHSRKYGNEIPRTTEPDRLLFSPIETFLIDRAVGPKQSARIERASLPVIWTWLSRDLIPDEIEKAEPLIRDHILAGRNTDIQKLINELRCSAVSAINKIFDRFQEQPDERLRIAGHLGSEQALEDARDIAIIFENLDDLSEIRSALPQNIAALEGDLLETSTKLLGDICNRAPQLRPFGLALVMARLEHPAEIIRMAKAAVHSDASIKLESHAYRVAIELVLYEANIMARQAQDALGPMKNIKKICSYLRDYYSLAHGLNVEVEMSSTSSWAKKIRKIRTGLSDRVSSVIGDTPRQIKAVLSYDEKGRAEVPEHEIAAVEKLLILMNQCRRISGELALNETLSRTRRDSEQYLNMMGDAIVERIRRSDLASRLPLTSRLHIAERLTRIALGDEIAELLCRSGSLAIQSVESEDAALARQSA
ncbi:MAG: hypothetical protein JKY32_03960 [Rhizobiales bacterium]|nr:hypothetical protein [Hyphomicrobiales bacterium]